MKDKKRFIKILSVLLAFLMWMPVLTACGNHSGTENESAGETGTGSGEEGSASTVPDVGEISVKTLSKMQLVYPSNAGKTLLDEIGVLVSQIQRTYGVTLTTVPDSKPVSGKGEILIGKTNRTEALEYCGSFRYYEYGVRIRGNNLIITGGCEEVICSALIWVRKNIVEARKGGTSVFFKSSYAYEQKSDYNLDSLSLNGVPVQDYIVVYPNGSDVLKMLANRVAFWIRDAADCDIKVVSDSASSAGGYEILIGKTDRGGNFTVSPKSYEGVISASGKQITLTGSGIAGVAQAVTSFLREIDKKCEAGERNAALTFSGEQIAAPDDLFSAMSFNIFYKNVAERTEQVLQTILYAQPDVFGIQEGTTEWLSILTKQLNGLYQMSGKGEGRLERPDLCSFNPGASDEHNVIFFNPEKYELVEEGQKWLSGTPDVPSKYEKSAWPRSVNWVILKRRTDGKILCFANTHLDEIGDRDKQGTALANIMNGVIQRYNNCPVFITGDFNQESHEGGYRNIVSGGFNDSGKLAAVRINPDKTLFTPYFAECQPNTSGNHNSLVVDYCFSKNVSKDNILYYRVFLDKINGKFPSDHYPAYFRFRIT